MNTKDLTLENISKLTKLFPELLTEVEKEGELIKTIDIKKLKELVGDFADELDEVFELTWAGKNKSKQKIVTPINKTLRPIPIDSIDFENTENLFIEGDNFEVLKLLQESFLNKIKMIYIDPPYNTGTAIIYSNDFSQSKKEYDKSIKAVDEEGNKLFKNTLTNGRFHSDWLSMMYERLVIAKDLLSEDGVLVCAIDENEFSTLSLLIKEIFGESGYEHSYVSVVHNPRGQQGNNFSYVNEYLIFVYPSDNKKYLADFPKDNVDSRNLRDSGTESDRTDARNCFYPFIVKDSKIIDIGKVPDNSFHPQSANVHKDDGTIEVWPLTDNGDEKKWRYARQSVDSIIEKLEAKSGRNSIQIIFNKDSGTMRSVWANARYDASEYGTKLVANLLGTSGFSYPKSLWAVYDCIIAATKNNKDAVVLDFFSGSGTTAHAVMQLNADDGGNRKYIMVQAPEDLDQSLKIVENAEKTTIQNAINFLDSIEKPHVLTEIGKERIKRAAQQIKQDLKEKKQTKLGEEKIVPSEHDFGFRVFKLDSSNMKDVYYNPSEVDQRTLINYKDNIKEERSDKDLLFQILLELAIPISAKINEEQVNNKTIYRVNDDFLIACFDDEIDLETIKKIAEYNPLRIVFKDSSFKDDATKVNCDEYLKNKLPNTIRKVI